MYFLIKQKKFKHHNGEEINTFRKQKLASALLHSKYFKVELYMVAKIAKNGFE